MKKILLLLTMVLAFNLLNAQDLTKTTDSMSEQTYWSVSNPPLYETLDGKWFYLDVYFGKDDINEYGVPKITMLTAKIVGLECVENVETILLFDNGEKIKLKSWNKFNCKGNAYFNLSEDELNKVLTLPLKTVRVTNGRNYKSFTIDCKSPEHFVKVKGQMDNGLFIEKVN